MNRVAMGLALAAWGAVAAFAESPPELLERFLTVVNRQLDELPHYVCTQATDRFFRPNSDKPWQPQDHFVLEVAVVGDQELFSKPGEGAFEERPMERLVGSGTFGTGHYSAFARHVFANRQTRFAYRGQGEWKGRKTHEFDFEVATQTSSYRLSDGKLESPVGFQGWFQMDAETLDLLQLTVQAFDIPEYLGLLQADTTIEYAKFQVGPAQLLLPHAAQLLVVADDGAESMNRIRLGQCRQYKADSHLAFRVAEPALEPAAQTQAPSEGGIPAGALVELALDQELDIERVAPGDPVRAKLVLVQGADQAWKSPKSMQVAGTVVSLDKGNAPFPVIHLGLQFDTLQTGEREIPFSATMVDARSGGGLIRQSKTMDPKFDRSGAPRFDVLVREVRRGQGVLVWDARKGNVPRGLRMKWRVQEPQVVTTRQP